MRSNHGVTPLFAAAAHGHVALVKLLAGESSSPHPHPILTSSSPHIVAEAGADTECTLRNKMPDGSTGTVRPIDVAAQKGHDEVVEFLQSRGSELTVQGGPRETTSIALLSLTPSLTPSPVPRFIL